MEEDSYKKYGILTVNFIPLQNGLLSSLPYLGKYLMAVAASYLADFLRQSGKLSTTAARKIFTTFGELPFLLSNNHY